MGEMLANISHQWKQPLNTINLAVINARMQLTDTQKREKNYDIIEENINYLASTINDFMSYFDKRTHADIRDLEDIISEIKSIASQSIQRSGAELFIGIDNRETKKIKIASSISQILLNLINNAKDALSDVEGEKKIKVTFLVTKDKLIISCCDNGSGIDDAIKEQIFNPYFTTKVQSQGTGIGLYMSRQITDKFFNGEITVEDLDGKTCFKVLIPFAENCYIEDEK
jgi:signal transduction histidine kinase